VSSENDELEYDLSAFEAPEPPDGIADAVIARLDGTGVTPAVPAEPREGKRRAYVVTGVAVACLAAAAGTYALVQGSRRAGPTRGDVMAAKARTLSLDGVSAELDAGAQVKWQRRGEILDVEQRAGAAAWRVDSDTTLRIDAGAMVASVEATGASLRVEVSMNATDVRVIGGSALTAAIVSMVTVTVYTGHVKCSERGQTVIVQPGETHTIVPPQPAPPEPVVAGAPEPVKQNVDHTVAAGCDEVSCVLNNYQGACCARFKAGHPAPAADTCDEVSCVMSDDNPACCAKYKKSPTPAPGDTLDRAAISEGIAKVMPNIRACGKDVVTDGKVVTKVTVLPDGSVSSATATQAFSQSVAVCVTGVLRGATFLATKQGGSFSYPFVF
jgi:hypothetical protein